MPAHQGLVVLAKVEPHAAPNAAVSVLADAAFREQRSHHPVRQRDAVFTTQRQRIFAGQISVAGKDLEIVLQVIGDVHLIEEAGLEIEVCEHAADQGGCAVAAFDTGHSLKRPAPGVPCGLRPEVADPNTAGLVPGGIGPVDTEQALGRIAPEQVRGDGAEEAVVETRHRAVNLRAKLATQRQAQRSCAAVKRIVSERAAPCAELAVDAVHGRDARVALRRGFGREIELGAPGRADSSAREYDPATEHRECGGA